MRAMAPALILSVGAGIGYPLLFAIVASEAAGLPVPGETALLAAAVAAAQHRLHIVAVITVAAGAAIAGDNVGYLIGRRLGRRVLEADGPLRRHRRRVLEIGEPFFARHGAKAVFLGRWITGLRTWASWLAGTTGMPWRTFAAWNAAGGTAWAVTIGLLAYALGHAVSGLEGLLTASAAVMVVATGILILRRRRRTGRETAEPAGATEATRAAPQRRQR